MTPVCTLLICAITALVSLAAFSRREIMDRLMFRPDRILAHKEWDRLLGSGLIHLNFPHLAFNLFTLFLFGEVIEAMYGGLTLLGIHVAAVGCGSLLSLYLHRFQDYSALGASGGVCGVMFASIFLVPGMSVSMLFLPLWIPGPLFALVYLAGTFVALRRGTGRIGHDAHFGGALAGLVIALALAPRNCLEAPWLFGGSLLVAAGALYVLATDPFGYGKRWFSAGTGNHQPTDRFQRYDENLARRKESDEIDRILDKINERGLHSLTQKERATLNRASGPGKPSGR